MCTSWLVVRRLVVLVLACGGCRENKKPRDEMPVEDLRHLAGDAAAPTSNPTPASAPTIDAPSVCDDPPLPAVPAGAPRVIAVYADERTFWPEDADARARARLFAHVARRVAEKERARLLPGSEIDAMRAKVGDELVCVTPRWTRALVAQYPNLLTASLGTECLSESWCAITVMVEDHTRGGGARWHGWTQGYDRTVDETREMMAAANRLEPMGVVAPQ